MKKRLLSAVLALAMALTLLPLSVFAAAATPEASVSAPVEGTAVQYVSGTDHSKLDASNQPISNAWAWQYKNAADNNKLTWTSGTPGGIVVGTSASGQWHSSPINATTGKLWSSSFTLCGDTTLSDLGGATSFSVNTFGSALTISASLNTVNQVTITDTAATPGSVSGLTRSVGTYTQGTPATTMSASGLTLQVTNVTITGGISLTGRANRVTLTGVSGTDAIVLNGETTVTNTNGTSATTYDAQTLTINPKANNTKSSAGAVTVTGNGSQVALNGVDVGAVTVTSTGGSLKVDNGATTQAVTIASGDVKGTDAPPAVTVNNGSVAGITYTQGTNSTAAANIIVNAQGSATGDIDVWSGSVAIHSANVKNVTVDQGSLTMDGTNGTAGDITLADEGRTTFNFAGTGYTVGDLTATNGNSLTIGNNWPVGRSNTFGELTLTGYAGQGIKGGIFETAANTSAMALWFNPDLQFMRNFDTTKYAYYGTRELAAAIADAGAEAKDDGTLTVIGATKTKEVQFYNSSLEAASRTNAVAVVGYGVSTGIYLPDKINGTPVATWTDLENLKEYSVNEIVPISAQIAAREIKMVLQSSGAAVTKLTNAVATSSTSANKNITATLSNNQIVLTGAVGQASYEDITLTLTTDVIGADGDPVDFQVLVSYNTTTKESAFSTLGMANPPLGVTVNRNNIVVGNTTYTLTTSALAKPASNLKVAGITGEYAYVSATLTGKSIVPTVNVAGMGNVGRKELADKLAEGEFDWTTSPAMRQVVNQAMTTITANNTLDNYVLAAQRAAWTGLGNKGKTPSEAELNATGYDTAVLEPYLAMTVSYYNESGAMTATLTPSYRVVVVSTVAANQTALAGKNGFTAEGYYIAAQGRALTNPIENLKGATPDVGVTLKLGDVPSGFDTAIMHQDGTYVYTPTTKTYTLTHAGKTGLGTVVLNKVAPLVTVTKTLAGGGTATSGYDVLQAAIDDAEEGDVVTVTAAYTGSGVINVTGTARTFTVVTEGQTVITPANNNFTVQPDATGHTFTVQLLKDVLVAGNVAINVAEGSTGTVTLSASKAREGDTIIVTVQPAQGNSVTGVTAKTNTGAGVTVTASSTTANQYTFVVPKGATSVTVTPTFKQGTAQATVSVSTSTQGTATTTAAATNNKVNAGSNVGVTTSPGVGYRTMGVNITTNGGAASASRMGDNYFTFTVPSNATAVTVTPVYDRDNGTKFTDVWSTEYYSKSVAWAVSKGVTDGQSTYLFGSNNYCTRAQMVTFLWRAAGRPSVTGIANPFVDVSPTLTPGDYYNAILWAVSQGITDGTDRTHFSPSKTVSRAEAVTFLYRYEKSPAASASNAFYDVPASQWYAKAVTWAANKGITKGRTNTTFDPNAACKRCEIVTFLYRDVTGDIT